MAEQEMSDIFMYMLDYGGNEVKGESSLQVAAKDTFMTEFSSADYDSYSNFFDVTDFSFELEMADDDSHGSSGAGPFSDWYMQKDPLRSFGMGPDGKSTHKYDVKKVAGNLSKVVDSVSPLFFQNCCLKKPFKQAILVKRAFTGARTADGDSQALGFLRVFMEEVLITNVSWDDGDLLTEKLSFKCKRMQVKYKKQLDNGGLGDAALIFDWKWSSGNTPSSGGR
jgi:type VI protein secretion system component Hcp